MNIKELINARTRVIVIAGLILIALFSLFSYTDAIRSIFGTLFSILMPFVIAFFLAFLLTPLYKLIKSKVIGKLIKNDRLSSIISALITLFILALFLIMFFLFVVPQLVSSINNLINNLPGFFDEMSVYLSSLELEYDIEHEITQLLNRGVNWVENNFELLLRSSYSFLASLWTSVIDFVWGFILSLIFMMVLLMDGEQLSKSIKKLNYSLFSKRVGDELVSFIRMTADVFRNYFVGQALDSLILGVILFVVLMVLGFPYAILIGVTITITNMIPFFGPFLGAIPSILILATVDINYAIQFAIIILVAQQLDGNILSPYILGDSLQLPSFMVMFSITVFGGLFGLPGMIFGVPTFAVMYRLFKRFVNYRLEKI